MTTKRSKKAATKASAAKALAPRDLARREAIFRVYRDMGPTRSYKRLLVAIADTHGKVSARTLNEWSSQHSWAERLREHDAQLAQAVRADEASRQYDPNFDAEEALLHSAQIALNRALSANVTPANPHQMKALTDLAINAIKLVDLRRQGRKDVAEQASGRKRVTELLDAIEDRVRKAMGMRGKVIDAEATVVTPAAESGAGSVSRPDLALPDHSQPDEQTGEQLSEHGIETREPEAALEPRSGGKPLTMAERLALRRHGA